MNVDQQHFLDNGYLIIRQCIPPDRLDELRGSFEALVDRQREIWARERGPGDPPGGVWETGAQPRVSFDEVVDADTANTVEFCLHENTLGVSRQLLSGDEVGVHQLQLMCNPVSDHPGGTGWHRDTSPDGDVPLEGVQQDMLSNGPGYVQWNIPMYDDNVLWVVPGSNREPTTPDQLAQLRKDRLAPPPGGIPVELKAGDGVVYVNHMLHSGANYGTTLRRTIHIGYQSFGGAMLRYFHLWWKPGFADALPDTAREPFQRWEKAIARQHDLVESAYRGMLDRDAARFNAALDALHSGEQWKMACLVLLCKIVKIIRAETLTGAALPKNQYLYDDMERRFTPAELDALWDRFGPLDERLQGEPQETRPGDPRRITNYNAYEMPAAYDVQDFVSGWKSA